jgi:predicted secreted Zn-dependent protease
MTLRILPPGAISAGVHHSFSEATLADIVARMGNMAEAALAEFEFNLSFDHANNRLTRVDLTMRLTLDMPEWPNASQRPQPEQDEWNRFLRALRVHEDGHIAIFRSQAPTAFQRVSRARPDTAEAVLERERLRIIGLSDAYDHRTDHGRTQRTPHGTTVITVPP